MPKLTLLMKRSSLFGKRTDSGPFGNRIWQARKCLGLFIINATFTDQCYKHAEIKLAPP